MADEYMIITRRKSPPHENPTELVYEGEAIETKDIVKRLGLDGDLGMYWWNICKITKTDEGLRFSAGIYTLESGSLERQSIREVRIPGNREVSEGLINFLSEKS